jgi:phospholipid transport system substrate-binding protein
MKKSLRLLALLLVPALPQAAAVARAAAPVSVGVVMASHDPAALFIRDVGQQFPKVLGDAGTTEAKRKRLTPFIAEVVDVEAVSRFCLGRYWAVATPAQRSRYEALFLKSLVNSVANRMANYSDGLGHVVVETPMVHPDGTYVPTRVKGSTTPEVHVSWVVETNRSPMRIVDVVAEGMSLRLAKRSDFVAYLARHDGDINAFLDALERQTSQ